MLSTLSLNDYPRTRPLFGDLPECHLCIDATLNGVNPGHVWVDDAEQPRSVFLTGVEGSFLAGDPDNAAFNAALRDLIAHTLFGEWKYRALSLDVFPVGWTDCLPEIVPWPPVRNPRRHYVCTALAIDWRARVPDGFAVRRIDQTLLDTPGIQIPGHVYEWMRWNWGSDAAFLEHAFGFATVHDNRAVSWSLVDCTHGARCEIGIQTEPDYRRRGLATVTVAATVDHALSHGYTEIGWQCNDDNAGSFGTAEKVGFRHVHNYTHYDCMATEALYRAEIAYHQARKDGHNDH